MSRGREIVQCKKFSSANAGPKNQEDVWGSSYWGRPETEPLVAVFQPNCTPWEQGLCLCFHSKHSQCLAQSLAHSKQPRILFYFIFLSEYMNQKGGFTHETRGRNRGLKEERGGESRREVDVLFH